MPALITTIAITLFGLITWTLVRSRTESDDQEAQNLIDHKFETAAATSQSLFDKPLLVAARPIAKLTPIQNAGQNPAWRTLSTKVAMSQLYGGSIEVYIAVQLLATVLGFIALSYTLFVVTGLWPKVFGVLVAFLAVVLPYERIRTSAQARAEEVTRALPGFIELLQMPLITGQGIQRALEFTAVRDTSIVGRETLGLLELLRARALPEREAYQQIGARLGTPEAAAFFNSLGQAAVEGTEVVHTIAQQSEAIRKKSYELARAQMKRLPLTLVGIQVAHFIPLLLISAMIPLIESLNTL